MRAGALTLLLLGAAAEAATPPAAAPGNRANYAGVDLSYVNEVESCGAQFRVGGKTRDAFELFAEAGANLVRLRLWNDPDWTKFSTEADVARSSERAKKAGGGKHFQGTLIILQSSLGIQPTCEFPRGNY